jgi:hypothetical protein
LPQIVSHDDSRIGTKIKNPTLAQSARMGHPNFKIKLQDPTSEPSFKTSFQNPTSKSHGEIARERMKLQILFSSVNQFDRNNGRIAESARNRKGEFLLPV